MFKDIKAVAFDIDGTLYSSWNLYVRMSFYFFRHLRFYLRYNKVRKQLHKTAVLPDFYEYQARLLADDLKTSPEEARELIRIICYTGLNQFFVKMKPFPYAKECIKEFKDAGLKIGILSDFPPEQKGDIWGIKELCDVCMGSEEAGALKPCVYSFGILAKKLEVKPEEILYVGNSKKYDVRGAKKSGMKTAYIQTGLGKLFNIKCLEADISFRNYKELCKIVLQ